MNAPPPAFRRRIVVLCEGRGDELSLPGLITNSLGEAARADGWYVDPNTIQQAELTKLIGRKADADPLERWKNFVRIGQRRSSDVGAVILVSDADRRSRIDHPAYFKRFSTHDFCIANVSTWFSEVIADDCRRRGISLGIIIVEQEYEAWLLAGHTGSLPEGHRLQQIDFNHPRDAKGLLRELKPGYTPSTHQAELTKTADWSRVEALCPSYAHFLHTLKLITETAFNNKLFLTGTSESTE